MLLSSSVRIPVLAAHQFSRSSSVYTSGPPTSTNNDTTRDPFDSMSDRDFEDDTGAGSDHDNKEAKQVMQKQATGQEEKQQFRTHLQQKKYENALDQEKRESGMSPQHI